MSSITIGSNVRLGEAAPASFHDYIYTTTLFFPSLILMARICFGEVLWSVESLQELAHLPMVLWWGRFVPCDLPAIVRWWQIEEALIDIFGVSGEIILTPLTASESPIDANIWDLRLLYHQSWVCWAAGPQRLYWECSTTVSTLRAFFFHGRSSRYKCGLAST